jgi:hypothetical protein
LQQLAMDPLHRRLARLALARTSDYGFCLAGGYAVQEHGFLDRPSEDVDLFTTATAEDRFAEALTAVIDAFEADGLDVSATVAGSGFARLRVVDPDAGATAKVELGIDWRAHPPVMLAIGPVLHPDDAVANKVCALFSRAQARDYIDVDAVLRSGRYSSDDLLALARSHDPGFDTTVFVTALRAIRRLPAAEFTPYGLPEPDVVALTARILEWADALRPRA